MDYSNVWNWIAIALAAGALVSLVQFYVGLYRSKRR